MKSCVYVLVCAVLGNGRFYYVCIVRCGGYLQGATRQWVIYTTRKQWLFARVCQADCQHKLLNTGQSLVCRFGQNLIYIRTVYSQNFVM